jgi:hypothetical protein
MMNLLRYPVVFGVHPWLRRAAPPGFDIGAQKYSWFFDTV